MLRRSLLALVAAAAIGLASFATLAQDKSQGGPTTRPKTAEYPLDMCPVMNVKIDSKGSPVVKEIDGRTVKLCCARCARSFEQNPERFHAKMDDMIIAKQKDGYALKTCPVSGEELGGMGEPVNLVDRGSNRLVRLCCEGCVEAFKEEPAKYLAKLDEAQKK